MSEDPTAGMSRREVRVRHIAKLMASGDWMMNRLQRRDLAEEWGVTVDAIHSYAAEAHRVLALAPEEREHLRTIQAARFAAIADRARTTLNVITGMPDFRAEIDAVKLYGEYSGLKVGEDGAARVPTKIEIVHAPEPNEDRPVAVPGSDEGPQGVPPG